MHDVVGLIGLLVFLVAIIVIPVVVWKVFKGTSKQFSDVFAQAEATKKRQAEKECETQVFRLAAEHGGRVTAVRVAQATDMTLEDATAYLEGLVKAGAAEMLVQDTGTIEFRFDLPSD